MGRRIDKGGWMDGYLVKQREWKAPGGIQAVRMNTSLLSPPTSNLLSLFGALLLGPQQGSGVGRAHHTFIYHERTSQTFLSLGLVLALIPCLVSEVKKHGV